MTSAPVIERLEMTRVTSQFERALANGIEQTNTNSASHPAHAETSSNDSKSVLPSGEPELLRELMKAIRAIPYGSILLTIHEGQLVEISKTTRLRRSTRSRKE